MLKIILKYAYSEMRQVSKVVGMSDWYLGLLGLVFESDTLQKKMDHTVWDFDLYKTKDWHTYYHASKKQHWVFETRLVIFIWYS